MLGTEEEWEADLVDLIFGEPAEPSTQWKRKSLLSEGPPALKKLLAFIESAITSNSQLACKSQLADPWPYSLRHAFLIELT